MPRTIYYERSSKKPGIIRTKKLHILIISLAIFFSTTSEGSMSSLPVITSATSASGSVGTTFSYQITATNSPRRYSATGLPTGVTLNSRTGLMSGTPSMAGTYEVTLEATNQDGTGTATLTAAISGSAPVISAAAASETVGSAFSYQITTVNSPTSYGATALPAGLALNSTTGLISGAPSASGASSLLEGGGMSALPVITSATSASGSVGATFSYQITATNSPWRYDATGLPTGVALNSRTGLISGTPTTAGSYAITLQATNRRGTGTANLAATISAGSAPVISSAATASGTAGNAFSYQITASNSPSSYGATGLPSGLSVSSTTGLISGTPSASGTSTVTLSASNSAGTGTASLAITIATPIPTITSATTASGTAGSAFTYQITATNSPTSYGAAGLPAGLSVNSTTGLISGTPSSGGKSTITLSASNSGGSGTASLTLTINSASTSSTFTVSPTTLAFENQPVTTTSSAQVATVTNSGSSAQTLSSISLTGTNASDFSETNTCGAALSAGGYCTIAIQFTPAAFGTGTATLSISGNSGSNPQTVALSGSGAHDVILTWTGSTSFGIVGYNIYRGTTSGGEGSKPLNSSPISGLTYADSNVQAGQEYFYYITTVGAGGTSQSPPSSETSATVPTQ